MGALAPVEITPEIIQEYRTEHRGEVTDGTVRRELGALVAVLNWAQEKRLVAGAEVPIVTLPPASRARDVWLDEREESELYALALGHSLGRERLSRLTRFVALALDTAARKAAIEGLTWDRVDLGVGLIDFRDPGVKLTRKRRVPIPVATRLRPVLERAWHERTGDYVLDHAGNIRKTWETFLSGTRWPDLHIHDLRRTWATLAARRGVALWQIAGVLGDTVEAVGAHYAHHAPDHLRGAVG